MYIEYPKALYKDGRLVPDEPYETITVSSREEEEEAAERGFYPIGARIQSDKAGMNFRNGVTPKKDEKKEDDSDLAALRAQAEKAGIEVDNRWGEKRLHEEIKKAK